MILLNNPLLKATNARVRANIRRKFPELTSCPHDQILALGKYVHHLPERYFSTVAFRTFLTWLQKRDQSNRLELKDHLITEEADLNRAFLHLREINSLDWHDQPAELDEYDMVHFVDREVHPTYLRLTEAVYAPIARIAATFSRLDRGKGTHNLDVYNVVEELPRASLSDITPPYNNLVRNGIAHGGITFLQDKIRYQDKKGNEGEYGTGEIVTLCDDMLDTCNGLALALSLFLLSPKSDGYSLPRELLLDELREETRSPWWEIVGCTLGEIIGNRKQLMIHVQVRTFDYRTVLFFCLRSAILAEVFASGFDRYFFALRSPFALPGWAAFNGCTLGELRSNPDVKLDDYASAVEDGMIFFVPKVKVPSGLSRLTFRVIAFITSFRLHWPLAISDIRERLGIPDIRVRTSHIHRNGWRVVLRGAVVLESPSNAEVDQDAVRHNTGRVIKAALRQARRKLPVYSITRYLPLGFARVAVFCQDHRRRRLASYGLGGDLIATVQVSRIRRIKAPDIWGATIETTGPFRLAWNRAWLTSVQSASKLEGKGE